MARFCLADWMAQEQGKHTCACGCGEAITIQRHHHSRGVPRYRNGHYARIDNHMVGRAGALNPHYRTGSHTNQGGYIVVLNPARTCKRDKYVLEHRLVMERHLGRKLEPDEHIHHRNGDKTDNRLENLEVMGVREHARSHEQSRRARAGEDTYLSAKRRMRRHQPYRELLCP